MEEFYKLLKKHIESLNPKFQEKFSIKQSLYDDVILIQAALNDMVIYQLCTIIAIISLRFQTLDLLNLSDCNFREFRDADSTTFPTMTFIQACRAYVSSGLITPTDACNCNGACSTKKCCCRAAKIQCSTKCHSSKAKPCSNV